MPEQPTARRSNHRQTIAGVAKKRISWPVCSFTNEFASERRQRGLPF